MSKEDIDKVLQTLEKGYDIIENNIFKPELDYLVLGDSMLDNSVLPGIDIPLTLKEYLSEE